MPAKILEIRVTSGDTVEKGTVLIITESMKMEYALSAKSEGKVKTIHVRVGEEVEEGDLLIELET